MLVTSGMTDNSVLKGFLLNQPYILQGILFFCCRLSSWSFECCISAIIYVIQQPEYMTFFFFKSDIVWMALWQCIPEHAFFLSVFLYWKLKKCPCRNLLVKNHKVSLYASVVIVLVFSAHQQPFLSFQTLIHFFPCKILTIFCGSPTYVYSAKDF